MTIRKGSEDGEVVEEVILSDYETEKEMHDLLVKFGLEKMTPEEIEAKKHADEEKIRKHEARKHADEEKIREQLELAREAKARMEYQEMRAEEL